MSKSKKLRELFAKEGFFRIVGAHNGLTAKLIEKAGFEGIWASSLEVSASHAVPDANILTMTDYLNAAISMNDAVSIPIVVDVDQGYGNSINVIRMIQKFEAAGIAGVIMEDKKFPKQNSLLSGGKQELASIAEFAGKILAAKNAKKNPDFMVMARVEALIAGWGHEEAMKRAKAYVDAGADAIMIHSKKNDPAEVIRFLEEWKENVPVVIVPTNYYTFTEEKIKNHPKVKMVIYANHVIRSAVTAIKKTLKEINEQKGIHTISEKLIPVKELFELQGTLEMKDHEKRFVKDKEHITAIIPAAGKPIDETLQQIYLNDTPTCMLDVNGKTILQRNVELLNSCGISDINVITGYCSNKINVEGINKIENPDFSETKVFHSIMHAQEKMEGKTLITFSDILFEKDVIERIIKREEDIVLAVDSTYKMHPNRTGKKLDLVTARKNPVYGERTLTLDNDNEIIKIGSSVNFEEANFEFIGIALFSARGIELLKKIYHENVEEMKGADLTKAIQNLIEKGHKVKCLEIHKGWTEVHTFDDYKRVNAMLAQRGG